MSENKPSELLFVRSIMPHCKRIGPLWLKNITNLRQKGREHSSQNSSKAHEIFLKLDNKSTKQLNEEINIVVNLLRKLYREIQPQSIMNLIKCWLNFPEVKDDDSCIFTKGDCRGRMKRIDGGKGADKVWRLDTLIGILFHGLPLTSADSNMIYHTCQQDLCIRPQHLRFKVASVSLVLVLKVLEQTGYTIELDNVDKNRFDEFVDIAGPFGIQELETLRHELVQVTQMNSYKLACSTDDIFILDENPTLKKYYFKNTPPNSPINITPRSNGEEVKRRLIKRLFESSKCNTCHLELQDEAMNVDNIDNVTLSPTNSLTESDPPIIDNMPKRKFIPRLESDYSPDVKRHKSSQQRSDTITSDDIEEKELIEIMETKFRPKGKSKLELMNCLIPNISDSPFKLNFDNFIRALSRSESGSTLESFDKKRSSQISICGFSQMKRNSEDSSRLEEHRTNEFLDMIHSMGHQYNASSSLKMTPNIFSPVSDFIIQRSRNHRQHTDQQNCNYYFTILLLCFYFRFLCD